MSRTYKDCGKGINRRRIVKNSLYDKNLNIYGEDFYHRRKDRTLNRRLRKKLKRCNYGIKGYY